MEGKEHAYRKFFNDLKAGSISGPVLICGKEQYLADWAVSELRKRYVDASFGSLDSSVLDLEDMESKDPAGEIITACETISLFSPVRLVVVRGCDRFLAGSDRAFGAGTEELIRFMKNMPPEVILVFRALQPSMKNRLPKAIRDLGRVYDMVPLEKPELRSFALKRIRENGGSISRSVLEEFIGATGYFNKESTYDLYALASDAEKLAALSEGEEITPEMIEDVVTGDADKYIFTLLDHISEGRKDKALEYFRNIMRDEDLFRVLASAISQFELMLSVRQLDELGMNVGLMQKKLDIKNDFRIKRALRAAGRYRIGTLKKMLSELYEIDRKVKTGAMPGELAMELFIAGM